MINGIIAVLCAKIFDLGHEPKSEEGQNSDVESDFDSSDDDDEFLEHVVAINYVDRLQEIHGASQ